MNIKYIKTTDEKKYDLRDKRIVDTDNGVATQSANGLLSSTDKKKLDGIASGAEVNQNTFSNIKIGNTTIVADGKTDTVELTAGNNITLTPDETNDKITIAATDTNTTYMFEGGTNQFTVTPSNGTAQAVSITPSIANNVIGSNLTTDRIILGDGNSNIKASTAFIANSLFSSNNLVPTSKAVKDAINALPKPMIFKGTLGTDGTITSLPAAASGNTGFTYKVITEGKYASQDANIGDVFISNGSSWNLIPSGDEPKGTVTNIATGTGLTGGPITSSGTISHADTSSQASVSNSGRTYILSITLDSMGHVTGIASATETVINTDTKVTSVGNHYAPTEDASSQLDADASSTTAATWNSTSLVTGVTVKRDAKGHVVGLGVDSIKMPANPNTDIHVTQRLNTNTGNYPILSSAVNIANTTTNVDTIALRNNSIYANPSTGTITANKFNGSSTHAETSSQSGSIAIDVRATSYWGRLWEIDVIDRFLNDIDVTFLLQSAYQSIQGTLHVRIRQNGADGSGSYSLVCSMRLTSGNIPRSRLRLYYNNSTGNCQLWYDCDTTYGNINAKMLHKTNRLGMEVQSLGTLYNLRAVTEQTLPGTGYKYVEPVYAVYAEWDDIQNKPSDYPDVTHLYAGNGTAANAATTNGNTKLTIVDNTTPRESVTIKGTGGTTVTSDANGVVTINSTDTSKQFYFDTPLEEDGGYTFIISPRGNSTVTPTGSCYFIEIAALVNIGSGLYATRCAKFMVFCTWYSQLAGLRLVSPIYNSGLTSNCPILYHDKADGTDVGTETYNYNICNVPFNIPVQSGLMSVNIKVEGPDVSGCTCSRSYTSFKWPALEPNWSTV